MAGKMFATKAHMDEFERIAKETHGCEQIVLQCAIRLGELNFAQHKAWLVVGEYQKIDVTNGHYKLNRETAEITESDEKEV
jgi:hypothetical protein